MTVFRLALKDHCTSGIPTTQAFELSTDDKKADVWGISVWDCGLTTSNQIYPSVNPRRSVAAYLHAEKVQAFQEEGHTLSVEGDPLVECVDGHPKYYSGCEGHCVIKPFPKGSGKAAKKLRRDIRYHLVTCVHDMTFMPEP